MLTRFPSASVGQFAIQIAAIYNYNIVTTCSPKNFDLVKSYGASAVFNYNDEDVVEKIKSAAPHLVHVFDTIGNSTSSETASRAVSGDRGALCTVRPGKANTENVASHVQVSDVLVWTAFLKEHKYGKFVWPVGSQHAEGIEQVILIHFGRPLEKIMLFRLSCTMKFHDG